MFTFAAKPRMLRLRERATLSLPATVTLRAKLGPSWLFGSGGAEPRHVVAGSSGVSLRFNANTGRWFVNGGTQPRPAKATSTVGEYVFQLEGDVTSVVFEAMTIEEITGVADVLLYGLPQVLGIHMLFPCVVEHVTGTSSGGDFGYEARAIAFQAGLVNEADQNDRLHRALANLKLYTMPERRRVQAALVYFNRSARLLDAGHTRWEFMSESVLNLAKALESLFPPSGDGKTRDACRRGLSSLGYSNEDIEDWFVPALALRSKLDVAHVWLALLSSEQIEALTSYAENALDRFRDLLTRLVQLSIDGDVPIPEYVPSAGDSKAVAMIDVLACRMKARGLVAPEA